MSSQFNADTNCKVDAIHAHLGIMPPAMMPSATSCARKRVQLGCNCMYKAVDMLCGRAAHQDMYCEQPISEANHSSVPGGSRGCPAPCTWWRCRPCRASPPARPSSVSASPPAAPQQADTKILHLSVIRHSCRTIAVHRVNYKVNRLVRLCQSTERVPRRQRCRR